MEALSLSKKSGTRKATDVDNGAGNGQAQRDASVEWTLVVCVVCVVLLLRGVEAEGRGGRI